MEEQKYQVPAFNEEEYEEIDLLELLRSLLKEWKSILLWAGVAAAVGILIAFSIPDQYSVTAKMVPERVRQSNNNVSAIASMAGINLGASSTSDAFSPDLYPVIISSNPFVTDLFPIPVEYKWKKEAVSSDYYSYMLNIYREPWWVFLKRLPSKLKSLFRKTTPVTGYENLDLSRLTSEQSRVASRIRNSLSLKVDKNTNVVSLTVKAQDPGVAVQVATEVVERLKAYLVDYRTEKARRNLDYYQKLYDDYKQKYYSSQQRYASYVDSHQGVVLQRVRTEQERLQNEMNLHFQLYNSCAQQLQAAEAKVQEETPVFTMINPPVRPLSPSGHSRGLIILALAFLGAVAACFWILLGRGWVSRLKKRDDSAPAPEQPEADSRP